MALVDYTSSDEDGTPPSTGESPNLKRKRSDEASSGLPPLPSKFHDLYASTKRVSTRDDSSLHGGRKRVMPHIEGNWPTHLYIEWYPSTTEYGPLNKLISTLKEETLSEIHSFLSSDLGAPLPLHISLSRPVGFVTEQKDAFVDTLERAIKSSGIRPFDISFSNLDWVANFEKTRWFLVLRLNKPDLDGLNKLLHVSNHIVQEYGQPPLYTKAATPDVDSKNKKPARNKQESSWDNMEDLSAAFHISMAWTLSPPSEKLLELTKLTSLNYMEEIDQIRVEIEDVKAKVGNLVRSIPLPKTVILGNGLF